MERLPRFVIPGQPQHVILRGNNRTEIFCANADYPFYLEKLQKACATHGCDIHAYVLMTNHIHLLITPYEEQSIAKAIQMLGRYYTQYYNYSYQRTGTRWEGRYKAILIDSKTWLLTCMRYIELNPWWADMVAHPSDWKYLHNSSYSNTQHITLLDADFHSQERDDYGQKQAGSILRWRDRDHHHDHGAGTESAAR